MSSAPSTTIDASRQSVHTVRPNSRGIFPELLPGVIRNFYGDVALGNGTQWKMGAFKTQWGLFLGIEGYGAANFRSRTTAGCVARMLDIRTPADAANVADLINDQFLGDPPAERQGSYRPCWCDDDGDEG